MLIERMRRAALLDPTLYNEVEHDEEAITQAILVVVIAAVASGLGTLLGSFGGGPGVVGLASEVLTMLLNWAIWSYVTYWVGTRIFGGTATPGEMLRTLGFALSPAVLNVLGFLLCVGFLIRLGVFAWVLVAGVVAVREALDFDTQRAVGTVVVGWGVMVVIFVVQFILFASLGWSFRMV
jgi:hypothetical protein